MVLKNSRHFIGSSSGNNNTKAFGAPEVQNGFFVNGSIDEIKHQKIIDLHKPDYLVISSNDDPIVFTKKTIERFLHNRTLRHILVHNQLFFDCESLGLTNVDGE